jgi:hypothetical protein
VCAHRGPCLEKDPKVGLKLRCGCLEKKKIFVKEVSLILILHLTQNRGTRPRNLVYLVTPFTDWSRVVIHSS